MKIIVTGCSGHLGPWLIKDLLENGHEAVGLDLHPPVNPLCPVLSADLLNSGDVYSAIYAEQPDAIINLAAIPRPGITPARHTFLTNVTIAYNIFEAAAALGVPKIAHASTDSSYGMAFAKYPFLPEYLPMDEEHPQYPQDCYGGSKIINEQTAKIFSRANPDMQFVCVRICGLTEPEYLNDFRKIDHSSFENIKGGIRGLFSYIDMRDAASGFRLAVENDVPGFSAFNVMAKDTFTYIETDKLVSHFFPGIETRKVFSGNEALFSSEKATRILGWSQKYSWREH